LFFFLLPISLDNRTLVDSANIFFHSPWNRVTTADVPQTLSLDPSPTYLLHPSDLLARQLFRHNKSFVWNPYVGFGVPWIGGMQASPYFPFKIFEWILPFWEGADLVRTLLLLAAGLGSYLLAVSLGLDQGAALISAVSYMLCERFFVFINLSSFQVEALLPFMLFGIHRMVLFRSLRYSIVVGWIGASQFLGGFPEGSFIFCLISFAFFVFLTSHVSEHFWWKSHLALAVLAGAVALLLSGFQIGEFVRYLKLANHGHVNTYGWAVHSPADLIHLFAPYYLGFPLQHENHQWTPTSPFDHMRMTLFCGITTIILSIIGLIGSDNRRGRWFFFGCLVFFAGYDYGFAGLEKIGHLPLFNISSNVWNAWVIPLSLSILAGYGMHSILNGKHLWPRVAIAVVACVGLTLCCMSHFPRPTHEAYKFVVGPEMKRIAYCIVGFLITLTSSRHERFKRLTPWMILLILTFELYSVDVKVGFIRPRAYATNPPSLNWFLKTSHSERILGLHGIYPADTLLPHRIRDIRHMDAMYPKLYVDFAEAIWPGAHSSVYIPEHDSWQQYDSQLLDVASVRYVFSPSPLFTTSDALVDSVRNHSKSATFDKHLMNESGAFEIDDSPRAIRRALAKFTLLYSDANTYIYRNNDAVDRARFVPTYRPEDRSFGPNDMKDPSFDFRHEVFLKDYSRPDEGTCPSESADKVPIKTLQDDPRSYPVQRFSAL
jgi:hypothetical protein